MRVKDLNTPSILIHRGQLEKNIYDMQRLCDEHNKELWPMVKTHKSTEIAKLQLENGAQGFLTGTLDEAEALSRVGVKKIAYAYPLADKQNIERAVQISKNTQLYLSVDGIESARQINNVFKENLAKVKVLIIINCGLDRFGVKPEDILPLAHMIKELDALEITGISTHPGHVYAAANHGEIPKYSKDESDALEKSYHLLRGEGYEVDMVATGATPTVFDSVKNDIINVIRPGNYTFYDNIQMSIEIAKEEDCALTVLATIISHPEENKFIMDAGSKCFGLDKGAHGISLIQGYGYIKGHPELIVTGLSEEVGKIKVVGKTDIQVGDKVQIIPNHACSAANMTDYLIAHDGENILGTIEVDIRGGSSKRILSLD